MISADEFLNSMGTVHSSHDGRVNDQASSADCGNEPSTPKTVDQQSEEQKRFESCKEAALRSLDAAPRSSSDLAKRLRLKDYEEDVVSAVIQRLQELGLLDDEDYARSLLRYCLQRDMGERGVRMEMSRKGVEASLAISLIDEAAERGLFIDAAYELGRTVERRSRGLERKVRMRRLWSAGGRKGHNPDILRQVYADVFI
jgi:regulatory protein